METKKCKICGVEKPLSDFPTYYHKRHGRYITWPTCRECYNKRQKETCRDKNLYDRHGIYGAQYDLLFEQQSGVCAICSQSETAKDSQGKIRPLAVDHCHTTHKNRGLLCHSCNTGLGYFKDDPELMEKAAKYLRERK